MADEYKSIYSGQEVDNAVGIAQKALTTDNIVQTTGPSQTSIMSQSAVTAAIQTIKTGGTTVTVGGVSQQTWNADSKLNVSQGINNAGKAMVVGSDGNLNPQTIQTGGTSVTVNGQTQTTWNADTKINVFQGTENANKVLTVGDSGNVVLQNVPSGISTYSGQWGEDMFSFIAAASRKILYVEVTLGSQPTISGLNSITIDSNGTTFSTTSTSLPATIRFYKANNMMGSQIILFTSLLGIHIDISATYILGDFVSFCTLSQVKLTENNLQIIGSNNVSLPFFDSNATWVVVYSE